MISSRRSNTVSQMPKYEAKVKCINCGFLGIARIEKSIPVSHAECPECDCPNVLQRIIT